MMDNLVTINRPIEDVFEFVEGVDVGNRHLTGMVEILEYEPPRLYVYKTRREPYPFSLTAQMSFEETPSGTTIRGHVEFERHGLFWNWFMPIVRVFFKAKKKNFSPPKTIPGSSNKD